MSVNAINVYFSSSLQYKYFSSVISNDQIRNLLIKYGITPTGNPDNDLSALYQAMYPAATRQAAQINAPLHANQGGQQVQGSQAADARNANNIPWANLMNQIGLSATGNLASDYQAFNSKISTMQSSAASSYQSQANINQLISQASVVFSPQNNTVPTVPPQGQASSAPVSGSDIQAQLNRMYFFS